MSDTDARIARFHYELPKHALLGMTLATLLVFQVEILSQLGAAEQHMDVARIAGPAVVAYSLWPLISLMLYFADQFLNEYVISQFQEVKNE